MSVGGFAVVFDVFAVDSVGCDHRSDAARCGCEVCERERGVRNSPEWREELEGLVGRKKEEAEECLGVLWRVFKERYPEQGAKSGKESPTNPYVAAWSVCLKRNGGKGWMYR